MKNLTTGTKVEAHTGRLSIGTMFIYETFRSGEIIKVNAKSIRVNLTTERRTENGKTISEKETNISANFAFWKVRDDNGKTLYKNAQYGIIRL